ncbi:MAG: phosphoglucomutase [Actinomycetota bacterium]|nr:phosphoglucomutase [Actinomycetota bacterium]
MPHERAGRTAEASDLIDVAHLVTAYYTTWPNLEDPAQRVAFGTSGHRGCPLDGAFTEAHIVATTQAICDYRSMQGIAGPLFLGRDTHALSEPAWASALEVLAGNGVTALIDSRDRYTPTPAISHAILAHNRGPRGHDGNRADGIVVTPSHNPPGDGGFKYNPPHGGPADTDVTGWIAHRANELLTDALRQVRRVPLARARAAETTHGYDYLDRYVEDLPNVIDLDAIRGAGVRIGADPLGGASVDYWGRIAEQHLLDLTVVNPLVDATWRFMTLDWDGKIRMDCSSPFAMASLIQNRSSFDISTGNDADADRHGIVTPDAGLMNPNHFLAVAIRYLFTHRPQWPARAAVGKTLVSSSMIDRVAAGLGRRLLEVPVGFKWFVPGLLEGSIGFGGEESAGASFLRRNGSVWTTDKDGLIMALLAAEIQAVTGRSPSEHYRDLVAEHGDPAYARVDAPATREQKAVLAALSTDRVTTRHLLGEPIVLTTTTAPGNGAPLGGLKVTTETAWFAARPSGTEDVYKIYAESFRGAEHLQQIQQAARELVSQALAAGSLPEPSGPPAHPQPPADREPSGPYEPSEPSGLSEPQQPAGPPEPTADSAPTAPTPLPPPLPTTPPAREPLEESADDVGNALGQEYLLPPADTRPRNRYDQVSVPENQIPLPDPSTASFFTQPQHDPSQAGPGHGSPAPDPLPDERQDEESDTGSSVPEQGQHPQHPQQAQQAQQAQLPDDRP